LSFDTTLLDIICCPVTQMPLEIMPQSQLERLNESIRAHKIKQRNDVLLEEELEQALVTRDGKIAYPIRDGIPILLEGDGIVLSQLQAP
jgi:uncharacterized protein YbaR (Trm112 family)